MSKYGARKVIDDGYTFDSQAEHRRYCQLKLMQAGGLISDLRVHVSIELLPALKKPTLRAVTYEADFVYWEWEGHGGMPVLIIEDVKGAQTDVWKMKWNMLQRLYRDGKLRDVFQSAKIKLQIINATDV